MHYPATVGCSKLCRPQLVPPRWGRFFLTLLLVDPAREIRDGLFVDGRRLKLSRLPDRRQVAAGQDREEARGP